MTDKALFYLLLFTFIVTAATMINDKVIEKKGAEAERKFWENFKIVKK